jgi:amino acid adenylation domain-containing protein
MIRHPSTVTVIPLQIRERALARPSAPAVHGPDHELTYARLDRWAAALAAELRACGAGGTGGESVVGVLLPRSARLVAASLGVMYAGGAYLPLDPDHLAGRAAAILRGAGCSAVVTSPELAARVPAGPWPVVVSEGPPAAGQPPAPTAGVAMDALAYVIGTSGSTGHPRGVAVTHRGLANLCGWHAHAFGLGEHERAALVSSPAFDAAVWELWPYLAAGASVHVPDETAKRDPERLRDWLVAARITICFLPTALAGLVASLPWPPDAPLRVLLTGADTLYRHPPRGLPFRLVNDYGPTECTVVATSGDVAPAGLDHGRPSIGRAISGVTVQILDRDLHAVPPGSPGELCIGGAGVARGYVGNPALTAERFVPDPRGCGARMYRSGDRAALRADGEIAFLGRLDAQVEIRGFRVEPEEVAGALAAHPAVLQAAVTTWEPREGDARLAAYVVPGRGVLPGPVELRRHLAARLPDHMVPDTYLCLDSLPLTSSGKVDRSALPPPIGGARPRQVTAPRTPVEERLAGIVAELLTLERVGIEEDFFLLGGHSLLGAQLITRVRDAYGVDLTLQALFDNPTVGAMAREVERLIVERHESLTDDEVERMLA